MNSSDVSIIVQGKIIGNGSSNEITKRVCKSIRRLMPESQIILSTWEGEIVDDIPFDNLVLNKTFDANKIIRIGEETPLLHSVNHQIVTTLNGLKAADRIYAIKIRSDLELFNTNFLSFFDKYDEYPYNNPEYMKWKVFKKRVVSLPTYNVHSKRCIPFNISDWFFFGLKEDLLELFDIDLVDTYGLKVRENEQYPRGEDNFGAEQEIWIRCLRKHLSFQIRNAIDSSPQVLKNSEIALANNFVTVPASQLGLYSLKFGFSAYANDPWLSSSLYTLRDWELLYNKYGGGNIKVKAEYYNRVWRKIFIFTESIAKSNSLFNNTYKMLKPVIRKINERWHFNGT